MSDPKDPCIAAMMAVATQYDPPEALAAALAIAGAASCVMGETVTEAVDIFRAALPASERGLRAYFPKVMDKKVAYQETGKPSRPPHEPPHPPPRDGKEPHP